MLKDLLFPLLELLLCTDPGLPNEELGFSEVKVLKNLLFPLLELLLCTDPGVMTNAGMSFEGIRSMLPVFIKSFFGSDTELLSEDEFAR